MKTGEFRLMLYPKDFDRIHSFYADTLGLSITKEWNRGHDDRGVMFDVSGTTLELLSPEDGYQPFAGFGLRHNDWGDTSFQIIDPEGLKISLFTKD